MALRPEGTVADTERAGPRAVTGCPVEVFGRGEGSPGGGPTAFDDPSATFECLLKSKGLDQAVKKFGDCDSPRKVKRLDDGKHKFKVRAIDAAGNVDSSPAKDKFKVVD